MRAVALREDLERNSFMNGTRETLQLGMGAACLPHLQLQLMQKRPLVLFGFGNVVNREEAAYDHNLRLVWL